MVRANNAKVEWNTAKKRWEADIEVGTEMVKRPIPQHTEDAGEQALRDAAVAIAHDEGYELDPSKVTVRMGSGHLA
jgi:hypothetical protein